MQTLECIPPGVGRSDSWGTKHRWTKWQVICVFVQVRGGWEVYRDPHRLRVSLGSGGRRRQLLIQGHPVQRTGTVQYKIYAVSGSITDPNPFFIRHIFYSFESSAGLENLMKRPFENILMEVSFPIPKINQKLTKFI